MDDVLKKYKPVNYLFEGMNGGKYSPTSVAKILKKSFIKSRITKKCNSAYVET